MSNAKIVHLKASRSVFAAAGGRIGLFGYEEEAGTMRFQYGASPTVDVAYAALRNSPNTFSGANTFQNTVTVRDVLVHNQSGTSQSIGYIHSTSGNLRLIHSFDEAIDSFDFVTRNDDGNARNIALRIPRTTATAVNAGGSGGQPWNFTGGIWTGGTQRISSAGRFDASSIYDSALAGGGVRPLATDNAGMIFALDAINTLGNNSSLHILIAGGDGYFRDGFTPFASFGSGMLGIDALHDFARTAPWISKNSGGYADSGRYYCRSGLWVGSTGSEDQVVGARKTGWSTWTGTASRVARATRTIVAASASYVQAEASAMMQDIQYCQQAIKAILDDLTSHGLIGA